MRSPPRSRLCNFLLVAGASVYTGKVPRIRRCTSRSSIMGKVRQSNKEAKKQPAMTPKEKKVAKQTKKQSLDLTHP